MGMQSLAYATNAIRIRLSDALAPVPKTPRLKAKSARRVGLGLITPLVDPLLDKALQPVGKRGHWQLLVDAIRLLGATEIS